MNKTKAFRMPTFNDNTFVIATNLSIIIDKYDHFVADVV